MDEFLEKIEKHRHEFFRYVLRTVWDSNVAEDVFSSAVLAAYENRHKYTPGTNFRAWMFRILTNKCYVANRETMRAFEPLDDHRVNMVAINDEPGYRDVLEHPEDFMEECGDEIQRAFRRLSTAERSCILLRAAEKFSYQEIAEVLQMPVGTVMTHLSRGRAKLRKELLEFARQMGVVRNYPRLIKKKSPTSDTLKQEGMQP
ncbi:MAG: RNA polymerase sigma factor [Candidatus Hydrogenedentes bacterium]|nr:RNA polymerase sigma factor [Candidatus Hydrogenedentota bacterium]